MAMTYQNFASLGVNLNRQKYGPLDISNVFTSENDLKYYLTKGAHTEGVSEYWYKNADDKVVPYPYEGQVLATVIDGVVSVYALSLDAEGNFQTQEIAGKIEVDGTTIKLNDEGKLELVGLPADVEGKTYVPSYINGVLTWAEPDTSTAEGQAQEIEGLKTRAAALELTVNGKGEGEERVDGLVDKVADNTQAIADEATARAAADAELEDKIAEALQAAKDYADENDANIVYDDTALANRVKAIEDDYLKEADKYDDTELVSRVAGAEGKITTLEGTVAGNATAIAGEKSRAEAAEKALGERIDAIDFVDETELSEALEPITTALNTKAAQADLAALQARVEAFLDNTGAATEAIDTLQELINYINTHDDADINGILTSIRAIENKLAGIDSTVTAYVDAAIEAINIGDYAKAADMAALAGRVEALEAKPFDTYATKTEVEAVDAKFADYTKTSDLNTLLDGKVDDSEFTTFKADNTVAIATAKQEAIDAAAAAEEAKGYAVAADVADTYATKAMLEAHEGEIANELLAYAKTSDVNAELAKKIETATIAHSTDELAEGVTVDGTALNIVVDAYTKAETLAQIEEILDQINDNSESAASVDTKLTNHIKTYTEKVGQLEAKDAELEAAIATAQAQADKGVADAKTANDAIAALTNGAVADNTREIGVAKDLINTVNTTLTSKIAALEAKDTEFTTSITALETLVGGHTTTITEHGTAIAALQDKDIELAGLIQGNTNKFADYYTSAQVDLKVNELSAAIAAIDLEPYAKSEDVNAALDLKANAADVYTKDAADAAFMTQDEVDARINALIVAADPEGGKTIADIQNLVKYVDENAGEIASLVTTANANAAKLAGIDSTVTDYVAAQLAAVVTPKASTEITVADDGTLGLGEVSTDKLVHGSMTLVLDGGSAKAE